MTMNSNRERGVAFEATLCDMLCKHGFWAHNMAQKASGQPADVIAARNGKGYLIDCKVCSSNGFPLSRVEENQSLAMELWRMTGNGEGWFALRIKEQVIMLPYSIIEALIPVQSSVNMESIERHGLPFDLWVMVCS